VAVPASTPDERDALDAYSRIVTRVVEQVSGVHRPEEALAGRVQPLRRARRILGWPRFVLVDLALPWVPLHQAKVWGFRFPSGHFARPKKLP
jgi:hypothetical protein